jgi:hypothetical protein
MKTTVKLLLCVALMALPYVGFSQHFLPWVSDISVNGLNLGSVYTNAQVTAQWGTPTEYWSGESEFGLNETYDYSDNQFYYNDNGIFHSFYIMTSDFVVYVPRIGRFKVGDNISKISYLGNTADKPQASGILKLPSGDDQFIVEYSDDDIITKIYYISSI